MLLAFCISVWQWFITSATPLVCHLVVGYCWCWLFMLIVFVGCCWWFLFLIVFVDCCWWLFLFLTVVCHFCNTPRLSLEVLQQNIYKSTQKCSMKRFEPGVITSQNALSVRCPLSWVILVRTFFAPISTIMWHFNVALQSCIFVNCCIIMMHHCMQCILYYGLLHLCGKEVSAMWCGSQWYKIGMNGPTLVKRLRHAGTGCCTAPLPLWSKKCDFADFSVIS